MLSGSLVRSVLRDVVKYFPPTLSVIQSDLDLVVAGTPKACWLETEAAPSGIKPSPADTYKTSSSRTTFKSSISPP